MANPALPTPSDADPLLAAAGAQRRVSVPLVVLVILVAVGLAGWQGLQFFQGRPRPVLDTFLQASEAGDYETMAGLLAAVTRDRLLEQGVDFQQPERFMPYLFTDGKLVPQQAMVRHEVLSTRASGDSFIARVRTTVTTDSPIEPEEIDLIVRRESETTTWRVMTVVADGHPVGSTIGR